ncbi:MAG: helix-turn-helix domain-containing protein [Deltaproteobacteria bacterium]|nr:helix-turn-helix domain-containing protein [Deltaproteobacteria bacterium]
MNEKNRTSCGVEPLDLLLDGLYIGDNVIWCDTAGSLAQVFCQHFLETSRKNQKPIIYLNFDRPPKTILERFDFLANYPLLTILDCFTDGKGRSSNVFNRFYAHNRPGDACKVEKIIAPHDMDQVTENLYRVHGTMTGDVRLVFDSLTGMQELWGSEEEVIKFYAHSCPRLYELETIAYWIMEKEAHSPRLRASLNQLAQVTIELSLKRGTSFLTIQKADGRESTNLQKPFTYYAKDHVVNLSIDRRPASGFDLGQRLKELRLKRGFSQTELARLVGVTPSTISQVESNLIYPSLPALYKMAEVMSVEVGSFFRHMESADRLPIFSSETSSSVRLSGIPLESGRVGRWTPLDFEGKTEIYQIDIYPGQTLAGHFFRHKGEEFGYLLSGRLELKLNSQNLTMLPGQLLYLMADTPGGWTNPGPEPANLLWFICN